jgi:hypothetical protein
MSRLEQAANVDPLRGTTVSVKADDLYIAMRELRKYMVKADKYDELKRALATVGEALRDEL